MMALAEVAELIRESSKAGELLPSSAIEAEIAARTAPAGVSEAEPPRAAALIQEALRAHDDLRVMTDDSGGAWYFSEMFMTGAYARVLLLKTEGPHKMVAEVIREHSRLYPRAVPAALFQCSPFNLSGEEVARTLEEMKGKPAYRDIALLTTSIGNLFAYSTDHLDANHAAMLAEWADVGQADNP